MDNSKTKAKWTVKEDIKLLATVKKEGHKWSVVSQSLNHSRTEHDVKNRFHSLLTKARKHLTEEK